MSFHNKVVVESGMGSKRSVLEFPFRCSYKKLPSSEVENYLQPLYYHGQGNGVNNWLEHVKFNLARAFLLTIKRYIFRVLMHWGNLAFTTFICGLLSFAFPLEIIMYLKTLRFITTHTDFSFLPQ